MNRADAAGPLGHSDLVELHMLNALPLAACVLDAGARIVLANDLCQGLLPLGHPSRQIRGGDSCHELMERLGCEEWAIRQFTADLHEVIVGRRDSANVRFLCADGLPPRRLDAHALPIRGGAQGRTLVSFLDITDRRRAGLRANPPGTESAVTSARRFDDPQKRVDELEAFGRSVAHDLRNPLCAVDGFARMVLDSGARALTDDERENLQYIVRCTEQLSRMLDGLRSLAGLADEVPSCVPVDIAALAGDSAAILRQCHPEREVALDIPAPLPVNSDARLLGLVMQSLLENAWRNTALTPCAAVKVGITNRADGAVVYFVHDNGPGFSETAASKLFLPFGRRALAKDSAGDDVGLATAKRAIEKLNGSIWAESAPGQGATFYFTLG